MSLTYESKYDQVVGTVITEEGKILFKYIYQCYGQSLKNTPDVRKNPSAKYYDFYFHDRLTNHVDNKSLTISAETARYLDLLEQTGYAPNSEITFIPKAELPPTIACSHTNTGMIRIRHDLDTCTAQEMFLVGSCVRPLSHSPQMALDFIQLSELHPEIELSLLYQISCSVSFGNYARSQSGGNVLIEQASGLLNGKTFKNFYEDVAECKHPMLRTANTYYYPSKSMQSYCRYFTNTTAQILFKHPYQDGNINTAFIRCNGAKYSPEVVAASLDIDKAKEMFYTTTWARNPRKQPATQPKPNVELYEHKFMVVASQQTHYRRQHETTYQYE